jgi:hypothetical protein
MRLPLEKNGHPEKRREIHWNRGTLRLMTRPLRLFLPLLALVPALLAEEAKTSTALGFIRTQSIQEQISGLQTLSQEYVPANGAGPVIWLVGVAHLGTPEYYGGLQKRLDAQTSVLFEGVGADQLTKGAKLDTDSGLQSQLAKALGLVFQLDAIDYQRPNFHNSDMTPERLNDAIAKRATQSRERRKAANLLSAPIPPRHVLPMTRPPFRRWIIKPTRC